MTDLIITLILVGGLKNVTNKDSYFFALSFLCISFIICLYPLKQILVNLVLGGNKLQENFSCKNIWRYMLEVVRKPEMGYKFLRGEMKQTKEMKNNALAVFIGLQRTWGEDPPSWDFSFTEGFIFVQQS